MQLQVLATFISLVYAFSQTNGVSQLELFPGLKCSYNYDVEVHTHRGERSTKELNFKLNAQVFFSNFISEKVNVIFQIHVAIHACVPFINL